jgi:hypothetical protein
VLVALADADQYHVTVIPGRGFQASRAALDHHIRTLFEPAAARAGRRLPEPQPVATGLPQEAAYAKR